MRRGKRRHWHVDLLTEAGRVAGAWIVPGGDECALVAALSHLPMPIPGFGASDCRRCLSHLLRQPTLGGTRAADLAVCRYARHPKMGNLRPSAPEAFSATGHGAQVEGGPAEQAGEGGRLAINGIETALAFVVQHGVKSGTRAPRTHVG
jgi:hypothetical protein